MSRGELLTDADRTPSLQTMGEVIAQWLKADKNTILARYALKTNYRHILSLDYPRIKLVYLRGSYELIDQRLRDHIGHFMNRDLLQSQFDTLEEPTTAEAIYIEIFHRI